MKRLVFALTAIFAFCQYLGAQNRSSSIHPEWMRRVPSSEFSDITFVTVKLSAISYDDALYLSKGRLAEMLPTSWSISTEGMVSQSDTITVSSADRMKVSSDQISYLKVTAKGEPTMLKCQLVDDFTSGKIDNSSGYKDYAFLYQVAQNQESKLYSTSLTTNYKGAGVWRSLIVPGWGQMYKGSYVKGGFMLGGTLVMGTGAVVSEVMRNSLTRQWYSSKDDTFRYYTARKIETVETSRNILLGLTAACYIYSIVDAAVARGGRRVIIEPNRISYSF